MIRPFNRSRAVLLLILAMLALAALACNLFEGGTAATATPSGPTETPIGGIPTITINNPADGSEAVRGQEVLVQSTGRDTVGVTRVELRVNSFVVNTVSSPSATGEIEFAVLQTWVPASSGPATLEVVAYRGTVASDPARITVNVRETAAQVTATQPVPVGVTPQFEDQTCRARVDVDGLNYREGPSTDYRVIAVFTLGQAVPITGRLADNSWWQVRSGVNTGWISAQYSARTGDCSAVPVAVPPASPTPRPPTATPTPTATNTPVPNQPTNTPVPTSTFTATPEFVDLVVSAISGQTVLELGGDGTISTTYTITLRNQGTANINTAFRVNFRQPDGTVVELPEIITSLAAGQTVDITRNATFARSDTYRLEVIVDSTSQVNESDEGNNIRILDVTVTNPPQ